MAKSLIESSILILYENAVELGYNFVTFDLSQLIPDSEEGLTIKTALFKIMYYTTWFKIYLNFLIWICPFAFLKRILVRFSYYLFGL